MTGRLNGAEGAAPPQVRIAALLPRDRHPARVVLAVLAAFAITSILLLWIIQPR